MLSTTRKTAVNATAGNRGRCIVVAGPDGTGKSSLATTLIDRLTLLGHPVRHFHHRLRLLPGSAASLRPTTNPHAQTPYSAWLSTVKVAYLYVDELLGWLFKVRPFRRRGGWVVVERGWWDVAVDPRRYRVDLGGRGRLVVWLGRLLPAADLTIILVAAEEVIQGRKTELEAGELTRQLVAWRSMAELIPHAAIVDAGQPLHAIMESLAETLGIDQRTF